MQTCPAFQAVQKPLSITSDWWHGSISEFHVVHTYGVLLSLHREAVGHLSFIVMGLGFLETDLLPLRVYAAAGKKQ